MHDEIYVLCVRTMHHNVKSLVYKRRFRLALWLPPVLRARDQRALCNVHAQNVLGRGRYHYLRRGRGHRIWPVPSVVARTNSVENTRSTPVHCVFIYFQSTGGDGIRDRLCNDAEMQQHSAILLFAAGSIHTYYNFCILLKYSRGFVRILPAFKCVRQYAHDGDLRVRVSMKDKRPLRTAARMLHVSN